MTQDLRWAVRLPGPGWRSLCAPPLMPWGPLGSWIPCVGCPWVRAGGILLVWMCWMRGAVAVTPLRPPDLPPGPLWSRPHVLASPALSPAMIQSGRLRRRWRRRRRRKGSLGLQHPAGPLTLHGDRALSSDRHPGTLMVPVSLENLLRPEGDWQDLDHLLQLTELDYWGHVTSRLWGEQTDLAGCGLQWKLSLNFWHCWKMPSWNSTQTIPLNLFIKFSTSRFTSSSTGNSIPSCIEHYVAEMTDWLLVEMYIYGTRVRRGLPISSRLLPTAWTVV